MCYKFGLNPAKTVVGHHILDPQRKTDPQILFHKIRILYISQWIDEILFISYNFNDVG
ncbi:hypothetical protein [Chengkuizengella sediminis]|uniref:hypothetical protein n=1 Tax=Chengkuizengella sediminis TaxID=1885917 RepID=UPI0030B8605B